MSHGLDVWYSTCAMLKIYFVGPNHTSLSRNFAFVHSLLKGQVDDQLLWNPDWMFKGNKKGSLSMSKLVSRAGPSVAEMG